MKSIRTKNLWGIKKEEERGLERVNVRWEQSRERRSLGVSERWGCELDGKNSLDLELCRRGTS